MGYQLARWLINIFIILTSRVDVEGLEHMDGLQSFVLASNHIGRLDAILVYRFVDRRDLIMLVAEKYRENTLARWFATKLDAIFVDRFNADFTVLRKVLQRLKKGGVLVLAPEGTRSPTASLQKGWPGVSYLAVKAGVPVLPVGITGSEDKVFFSNLRRLRRTKVAIRVGEPFMLPSHQDRDREAGYQQNTDEIMCRIAALLPLAYRGIYTDHPRLNELLADA